MASDRTRLREQYATGSNLKARIALHARFRTSGPPFHEWLFDHMPIPEGARVLELGCGTGIFWQAVAPRVVTTWKVLLTDFSEGMTRESRDATTTLPCGIDVAVADAEGIPLHDGTVDVAIANHMLYHVPDVDRTLEEIRRVLTADGLLYAATISESHLHQLRELVARCVPDATSIHRPIRRFSAENGSEQLARWFGKVETEFVEGQLRVTDPAALIAYVESTGARRRFGQDALGRVGGAVREEIEEHGALVLDTKNVLFTCRA